LLYIWGSNKYSQLGLGDNQSRSEPSQVNIPNEDFLTQRNNQIVNVACGDTFTIVSTLSGELYSCGSNLQG
jgi:alpha-tubulin suppressor-like RCC1 family protein